MERKFKIPLDRLGGIAPDFAIYVDPNGAWCAILEQDLSRIPSHVAHPVPKQISHPVVMHDSSSLFPCVHRKNHVADTPCGGCGGNKFVALFACDKHEVCTVSRPAKNKEIRTCHHCPDRQPAAQVINFADYKNKYQGKTAIIMGRGATTFNDADLAQHDGPILAINDAVLQVEKYAPDNPDTFLFAQDKRIADILPNLKSIAVIPRVTDLSMQVETLRSIKGLGKVMWVIRSKHGDEELLAMSRDEIQMDRRLYRAARERLPEGGNGPSPTISLAIHFAWYCGVSKVKLIRCDGHATGYDASLENKSHSPVVNVHKYQQAREMADRVMRTLELDHEYVGTPDDPNAVRDVQESPPQ